MFGSPLIQIGRAAQTAGSEKVIFSFRADKNFQNGVFVLPICWRQD
jgi:hypothetical protein